MWKGGILPKNMDSIVMKQGLPVIYEITVRLPSRATSFTEDDICSATNKS